MHYSLRQAVLFLLIGATLGAAVAWVRSLTLTVADRHPKSVVGEGGFSHDIGGPSWLFSARRGLALTRVRGTAHSA